MSMRSQNPDAGATRAHWYELDALRFAAAMLVVAFHYTFVTWANVPAPTVRFEGLGEVTRYGYVGVHLFFVISGFVIAATLEGRSAATFGLARARRLYPVFWIACTLTAVVGLLGPGPHVGVRQWAANLTMVEGFFHADPVDAVYWTLDVEIRFYALVAVMLIVGGRRRLVAISRVWLALAVLHMLVPLPLPHPGLFGLEYAPLFVAGICYHDMIRGARVAHWQTLAVAVPASIIGAVRELPEVGRYFGTTFSPLVVGGLLLAIHVLFLTIVAGKLSIRPRRYLVTLGAITYPLYLVHENVGFAALRVLAPVFGRYGALALVVAGALALAWGIQELAVRVVTPAFDRAVAALVVAVQRVVPALWTRVVAVPAD